MDIGADIRDVRDKVLSVARGLFASRGVKRTTVDMIAQASGIAKGTVYNYFESKSDIFREVIHAEAMAVYSEIDAAVRQEKNVRDKMKAFVVAKVKAIRKRMNLYNLTKERYLNLSHLVRHELTFYYEREALLIEDILAEGLRKGEITVQEPALLARALVSAVKDFEDPWVVTENWETMERYLDTLLDVLYNGLRPRKEEG